MLSMKTYRRTQSQSTRRTWSDRTAQADRRGSRRKCQVTDDVGGDPGGGSKGFKEKRVLQ